MSEKKPFRALGHIYGPSYEKSMAQGDNDTKEALAKIAERRQEVRQIEALKQLLQEAKKESQQLREVIKRMQAKIALLESQKR